MNLSINVRRARFADVERIARFNAAMAIETEDLTLDIGRLTQGVKGVFEDAQRGFYLVAEIEGVMRACLMITTEWSDWRNGTFWWIQSVFVQDGFRKKGLYKAMYADLLKKVSLNDEIIGLRLYVEKENQIAKKTYESLGMLQTDYNLYEFSKIKI